MKQIKNLNLQIANCNGIQIAEVLHTQDDERVKWEIACLCRQRYRNVSAIADCLMLLEQGLSLENQEWFLDSCIRDPVSKMYSYASERKYLCKLIKQVIKKVEASAVCDGLAEELIDLEISYRGEEAMPGSTGCFEWDAGYFLAEYVLNHAEEFQNSVVLELGAGSGMMGAIVSRIMNRKFPIICTDGDVRTLENCRENLQENNALGPNIHLKQFQWESGWSDVAEFVGNCSEEFNTNGIVILGADLLYDPCIIPVIVPLLRDALIHHGGTNCAYLATARRSEETMKKFLHAVEQEEDLIMEDITGEAYECIESRQGIRFFHIPSLDEARNKKSIVLHRLVIKR
eukprot:jgi/Picsp_1/5110/NSC_02473-R1_s-adenosyl-l-methionine-dependent methyltransferase domain-containing protein